MNKLELQNFLFKKKPNRLDLLNFSECCENKKTVYVYRNHSFELIANTIKAYSLYSDLNLNFLYSGYDDSLSFVDLKNDADTILLWIDATRYKNIDFTNFLNERLKYLRSIYSKPIIVAVLGEKFITDVKDVLNVSFDDLESKLGDNFYDLKMETFTGTRLSNNALLELSKLFGLIYFPAVLSCAMKAIFIDLDNTIYKGVLGENAVNGVELTDGHKHLQEILHNLSQNNFCLCAVSKNNQQDVDNLFKTRNDFPLKYSDFTKIIANWDLKSNSIKKLIQFLNIGADSVLFIDDNIGEISEVVSVIPNIKYILADNDANISAEILKMYPGFLPFRKSNEDSLRKNDLIANETRKKMQDSLSQTDFLRQIKMEITIYCDDINGQERIAQLSGKTNQFIFNYRRYSLTDVQNLMKDDTSVIVSIHLRDSLSDSGMIGAIVLKADDKTAVLDDCFISCRALGRGIDDVIIFEAIDYGMKKLKCDKLKVLFVKGERNEPAQKFYEKYMYKYKEPDVFEKNPKTDLVKFLYK